MASAPRRFASATTNLASGYAWGGQGGGHGSHSQCELCAYSPRPSPRVGTTGGSAEMKKSTAPTSPLCSPARRREARSTANASCERRVDTKARDSAPARCNGRERLVCCSLTCEPGPQLSDHEELGCSLLASDTPLTFKPPLLPLRHGEGSRPTAPVQIQLHPLRSLYFASKVTFFGLARASRWRGERFCSRARRGGFIGARCPQQKR